MSAKPQRTAEVTVFSPIGSPTNHKLSGSLVTIGRASDCAIPIKDRYLSRRHAEFVPTSAGVEVRDLESRNGVMLNGSRVESAVVRPSDRVIMGDVSVAVRDDSPGTPVDAPAPGP